MNFPSRALLLGALSLLPAVPAAADHVSVSYLAQRKPLIQNTSGRDALLFELFGPHRSLGPELVAAPLVSRPPRADVGPAGVIGARARGWDAIPLPVPEPLSVRDLFPFLVFVPGGRP